ncbi:MAG: hypothetical protein ACXU8N_01120 [Telluria sp.]
MTGMKSLRKFLLVCLLLLAVPFQGAAAAGMLPCAGGHHVPAPASASKHPGAHAAHHACSRASAHQDSNHRCGSCAACSAGIALAPHPFVPPAVIEARARAIVFAPGYIPDVTPPALERPPRASPA